MNFRVEHFYKLLPYTFNIPSYQRGYRWEKKQVIDLLEDLKEFVIHIQNDTVNDGEFYSLQPVVVQRRDKENEFDLVDGQQRLTTLFLIMSFLSDVRRLLSKDTTMYSLIYESRKEDIAFLRDKLFTQDDNEDFRKNIDYFYIRQAYLQITKWFERSENEEFKLPFLQYLFTPGSTLSDEKNHDLRVIWYEIPKGESVEDALSQIEDQIEVFESLNYGKIPLTDTELIKALILQSDIYGDRKNVKKEWCYKVASDWDKMECDLQNPLFWAMLTAGKYDTPTHINLVIEFAVKYYLYHHDSDYNCYNKDVVNGLFADLKKDTHLVYAIVNRYLGARKEDYSEDDFRLLANKTDFESRVTELWNYIQNSYAVFRNWFDDSKTYHLLGLLVMLSDNQKRTVLSEQLFSLFSDYLSGKKSEFHKSLKKSIAKHLIYADKDGRKLPLTELTYTDTPIQIIKILEAHNVYQMIVSNQDNARFDFSEFSRQNVTSLEHIHPQNLNEDEIQFPALCDWYRSKAEFVMQCKNDEPQIVEPYEWLSDYFPSGLDEKSSEFKAAKEKYEDNKSECWQKIHLLDKVFDDMADMSEEVMHSLQNMALVDKDTNAALSNHLLDRKREILKSRIQKDGIYVPIGTLRVFSKYYTGSDIKGMKFWTEPDRNKYFADVMAAYNYFVED